MCIVSTSSASRNSGLGTSVQRARESIPVAAIYAGRREQLCASARRSPVDDTPRGSSQGGAPCLELAHDLETLASAAVPRFGGGARRAARRWDRRGRLLAVCRIPVTGGGYVVTPQEIAGPFPADGSNGPNVSTSSGIVRSDICSSFGGLTGAAIGSRSTIRPADHRRQRRQSSKPGAAVDLGTATNSVGTRSTRRASPTRTISAVRQVADQHGWVSFRSVFPGCYGRWPHIHFEVYPSLAEAVSYTSKLATLQPAVPPQAGVRRRVRDECVRRQRHQFGRGVRARTTFCLRWSCARDGRGHGRCDKRLRRHARRRRPLIADPKEEDRRGANSCAVRGRLFLKRLSRSSMNQIESRDRAIPCPCERGCSMSTTR